MGDPYGSDSAKPFLVGAVIAVGLNLLPFILSRGAYQSDGLEVIGFPFAFRALGGFAYRMYFYWSAFVGDLLFCDTVSVLAGYAVRTSVPLDTRAND